jgi:hypothetical protein
MFDFDSCNISFSIKNPWTIFGLVNIENSLHQKIIYKGSKGEVPGLMHSIALVLGF